jgi:hypothetical protein
MPIRRSDELSETSSTALVGCDLADGGNELAAESSPWSLSRSGGAYSDTLVSTGSRGTGAMDFPVRPARGDERHPTRPGLGFRIRRALHLSLEALDRAIADSGDIIERANALTEVRERLEELWDCRVAREKQFGMIINHLELLFRNIAVEDVTPGEMEALHSVLTGIGIRVQLTNPDVRNFLEQLAKAGVPLSRAIE